MTKVDHVPQGYHSVTPYLIVDDAKAALAYYAKAFGAIELMRHEADGGRIGHAEIKIGTSPVMLADEFPEIGARSPKSIGGSAVSLMLYVPDVDSVVASAVAGGGSIQRPVEDQFYGDRSGSVTDPFGHVWHVATHVEDVSPEEMEKRAAAARK